MPDEDERVGVLRLGLQGGARPALGIVDAAAREVRIAEDDERLDVLRGQIERLGQELDGAIVAIRVPLDGGEAAEGRGVRWSEAMGRGDMLPRLARPPVREQDAAEDQVRERRLGGEPARRLHLDERRPEPPLPHEGHGEQRVRAQLVRSERERPAELVDRGRELPAIEILGRDGKGRNDRLSMLPLRLVPPLRDRLTAVRAQQAAGVAAGTGWVSLPDALDRRYPNAGRE